MIASLSTEDKKNKQLTVLGIDFSLRSTGICVGYPGAWYTKALKNKLRGCERLLWLREQIKEFLHPRPALATLEGYSCDSIGRWYDIGEGGGVIKLLLYEQDVPVISVPPKSLKRFVTGGGTAKKSKMIQDVEKKYGVKTEDDNIADAVGLANIAWVYLTKSSRFRSELETIAQLDISKSPKVHFAAVRYSI